MNKVIQSQHFKAERAWGALDITNMNGISVRLHWTDKPYKWHINDGEEVFAVMDGTLKTILQEQYLPDVVFEEHFLLDNGKEISCVYVELPNVTIHNKATWQSAMKFLYQSMLQFEVFWAEYKDIIQEEK